MPQKAYPNTTAAVKQMPRIINVCFQLDLFFRRIIIPKPEFTNKPAKSAPKDKYPVR